MKTVVISLGGSILIPTLEKNRIKEYVPVLEEIAEHHRLFVVVGGGGEARRYIRLPGISVLMKGHRMRSGS